MKLRVVLWLYLIGALVIGVTNIYNAYVGGGFDRSHSVVQLLGIAGIYMGVSILWPIVMVIVGLQYFGLLPHPITFLR